MSADENKFLAQVVMSWHHTTEKAICISFDGEDQQWLPRSMVVWFKMDWPTKTVTIIMPEWLAVKRGLMDDPRLRGLVDGVVV